MATLSSIITPTNITTASNTQTLTNKTITGGILNGTLGATTPSTVAATLLNVAASTRPTITVETTGVTAKGRVFHADANAGGRLDLSSNLSFDGTNWQRDDTGQPSSIISLTGGLFQWRRANTGSNPASLTTILSGSDAGLAVTGTGTTSGNFGAGAAADGTFALLASSTTQRSQLTLKGSNVVGIRFQSTDINGGERNWGFANNIDAQGSLSVRYGASQGADPTTTMAQFSSTGLAVTGALSCTSDATFSALVMMPAVYNNTTGGGANLLVAGDGGNRLYRSTSSRKYKEEIIDYTSGLSEVLKLRPVFYKGKNKEADGDKQFAGLIAEEVDEVGLKEFVVYDKDGNPDALDYSHMVALAFKAIQEQDAQIKSLRKRLAALEAK